MNTSISREFKSQAIFQINENLPRIKNCLDRLSEEQVWQKPNSVSNSVGNLILHLCGNISQYILSSLGNNPDLRERDEEFSTTGGFTKDELYEKISGVISKAVEIINNCTDEQLLKITEVQCFEYSGIGKIIHVTEHLSYHTGQIAFWTKFLKDQDLGFYADASLNKKNK